MEPNTEFYAYVVADSLARGVRLTTFEICFPRFILAEFNTHRMLSRNSASSRAIPVKKQLDRVKNTPFIPRAFPMNKAGMSATEYIYPGDPEWDKVLSDWLFGRDMALRTARRLLRSNVHKQTANRVLEPYMYHTVVVTATDWDNFFNLRISPHAQPEINDIAEMMLAALNDSEPMPLQDGQWHLPYVDLSEHVGESWERVAKVSAGRCAAVTLLNQNKKDADKDVARAEGLIANGHMSPLEHPACVVAQDFLDYGNFHPPYLQYRKFIPGEKVYTNG